MAATSIKWPEYRLPKPNTNIEFDFENPALLAFLYFRMAKIGNIKLFSFPGDDLRNSLVWIASNSPELQNTNVIQRAIETLNTFQFVMLNVLLKRDDLEHSNVLIFYKSLEGIVVERFDPANIGSLFRPEILNLALQDVLRKTGQNIKYVTPIDQCAFNIDYRLPGQTKGTCVPFSIVHRFKIDKSVCRLCPSLTRNEKQMEK